MKILGITFDASRMGYVLVIHGNTGLPVVSVSGRLELAGKSRDVAALRAFRDNVRDLVARFAPDRLSIKAKPENGTMGAGPSALKMEALVVAGCTCDIVFPSSQSIKKVENLDGMFAYLQDAYKAALIGVTIDPSAEKPSKTKPKAKAAKTKD